MRRQTTKQPSGAAAKATPMPARAARIIKSSIIILRPLCGGGDDRHDRVHGRVHVGKVRVRRPFLTQTRPYILVQMPRPRAFLRSRYGY